MHTVYILRSINHPGRLYIGLTTDLEKRLVAHNADSSTYSKRYSPWELEMYLVLKDKKTAEDLEKYFKSGSGFAFLKKRLLPEMKIGDSKAERPPRSAFRGCLDGSRFRSRRYDSSERRARSSTG